MDKAPPIRQVSGQYHSSAWWEAGAGEGGGVEGQARVMVGLACCLLVASVCSSYPSAIHNLLCSLLLDGVDNFAEISVTSLRNFHGVLIK